MGPSAVTAVSHRLRSLLHLERGIFGNRFVYVGLTLTSNAFLSSGLGFLYWIVAARTASALNVGRASTIIASMMIVNFVSISGVTHIASRYLPISGSRRHWLTRRIHLVSLGLGAVGGAIFWLGSSVWAQPVNDFGPLFFVVTAAWTVFSVQDQVFLGLHRPGWLLAFNAAFNAIKLAILVLVTVAFGHIGWRALIWPWFTAMALVMLFGWAAAERFALRSSQRNEESEIPDRRNLARFALTNHIGSSILMQLPGLTYPVIVLSLLGEAPAAYFYSSWMIANLLMSISLTVSASMVAEAARPGNDPDATIRRGMLYTLGLVVPGVLFTIVLGHFLLSLFGAGYGSGYGCLVLLSISCVFHLINVFFAAAMRVTNQLRPVLIQGGVVALVALVFVWPLTKNMGLTGVGLAFLCGNAIAAIWAGRYFLWSTCDNRRKPVDAGVHR